MIKILGPMNRGNQIYQNNLRFLLIFWVIFFGVIFTFGNFCLDCTWSRKFVPNRRIPPTPLCFGVQRGLLRSVCVGGGGGGSNLLCTPSHPSMS